MGIASDIWFWITVHTATAFASGWSFIWHWGFGIGIIAICLILWYILGKFTIFGFDWLRSERKDLLWLAAVIAVFLAGMAVGTHDEAKRCKAQQIVIENVVTKAVKSSDANVLHDPYNNRKN